MTRCKPIVTTADRRKDKYLRERYGLTLCKYRKMLKAQDGMCAICRRPFGSKRKANVDHNHKTGRVRGILCYRCNKFLVGRHTIATITPVYEYLRKTDG